MRFLQLSPGEFFFTTLKVNVCVCACMHAQIWRTALCACMQLSWHECACMRKAAATRGSLARSCCVCPPLICPPTSHALAQVGGYAGLLLAVPTLLYEVSGHAAG